MTAGSYAGYLLLESGRHAVRPGDIGGEILELAPIIDAT